MLGLRPTIQPEFQKYGIILSSSLMPVKVTLTDLPGKPKHYKSARSLSFYKTFAYGRQWKTKPKVSFVFFEYHID